jgi:hypothetical protein
VIELEHERRVLAAVETWRRLENTSDVVSRRLDATLLRRAHLITVAVAAFPEIVTETAAAPVLVATGGPVECR